MSIINITGISIPIEVLETKTFTVRPEFENGRIIPRITPEPFDGRDAVLIYGLANKWYNTSIQLAQANNSLNDIIFKYQESQTDRINILKEKDRLEKEVIELKTEIINFEHKIDELKNENKELKQEIEILKQKELISENNNKEINERLQFLEEERSYVVFGAWIERARIEIMKDCGQQVDLSNLSQQWAEFTKTQNQLIKSSVKKLFDLSYKNWKRLSIDFYDNRNESCHRLIPYNKMKLYLNVLPYEFIPDKSSFEKLIDGVYKLLPSNVMIQTNIDDNDDDD